ncbi:MAG: hypothetical protein BA066_07185 [Candidatus Korarchaeota archaeon NZ13-K]|nr:MAG: hypothetical protein BA066_07185 [Candidatus Korarchaeota archaeon NZ13-K]
MCPFDISDESRLGFIRHKRCDMEWVCPALGLRALLKRKFKPIVKTHPGYADEGVRIIDFKYVN